MDALVEDLESKLAAARQGGGPKAAARMKSKGKLLPRERYEIQPDAYIVGLIRTLIG